MFAKPNLFEDGDATVAKGRAGKPVIKTQRLRQNLGNRMTRIKAIIRILEDDLHLTKISCRPFFNHRIQWFGLIQNDVA